MKVLKLTVRERPLNRPGHITHKKIFDGSPPFDLKALGGERNFFVSYFALFEFPDGSEKEFEIRNRYSRNKTLRECGTGKLTYKELKNSENYKDRWFIRYKRDGVKK